ncbi:MAG: SufE family protein [Bdellovibrio sp.]
MSVSTNQESLTLRARSVVEEFSKEIDWQARYQKLIQWGQSLKPLDPAEKTEEALVKACQSKVWLHVQLDSEGRMQLRGDSESVLVKGLVAVILRIYSGSKPVEILQFRPDFLEQMGFRENLSPSRANGVLGMIRQIHLFAHVFSQMGSGSKG